MEVFVGWGSIFWVVCIKESYRVYSWRLSEVGWIVLKNSSIEEKKKQKFSILNHYTNVVLLIRSSWFSKSLGCCFRMDLCALSRQIQSARHKLFITHVVYKIYITVFLVQLTCAT
jgi:hypothetical protein